MLAILATAPAGGTATLKITGYLMRYESKSGSITQITVLQPTPRGAKVLQEVHDFNVTKSTKFIFTDGDTKASLTPKSVLTDARTKEMMTQKAGATLGNNEGLRVVVEVKGTTATLVTFTPKKAADPKK
jgi:hypothetical protein